MSGSPAFINSYLPALLGQAWLVVSSEFHTVVEARGFSVLEVCDAVDRVTNMTIERRIEPRRAGDPDALIADNRAILARLPWRPRRDDLDGIVRDALAWERTLGERAGG